MNDCVFCKIVAGKIPAAVVYEDNTTLAFITIECINEGHTLVIPKQHVRYMHEMDENLYMDVMNTVRKISRATDAAYSPGRVGTMVSGWEIDHAHVHVVPMSVPSDITSKKMIDKQALFPDEDARAAQAKKISKYL